MCGNDLPQAQEIPGSYVSYGEMPYNAEYGPCPAGIPAGYHREVPACLCPLFLQKKRHTGLKLQVPVLPEIV